MDNKKLIDFTDEDTYGKMDLIAKLNKESVFYNQKISFKIKIYEIIKRILDIIFSLLAIIALSPLFILISIFIKVENQESIIFS